MPAEQDRIPSRARSLQSTCMPWQLVHAQDHFTGSLKGPSGLSLSDSPVLQDALDLYFGSV